MLLMLKVRGAVERLSSQQQQQQQHRGDWSAHVRSVRTWALSAVAAGCVLVGVCVGCFVLFREYSHLGWTVLSNQACIVVSLGVYGLYWSRVSAAIFLVNIDQHKAR